MNDLDSENLILLGDFNADWYRGGMWNYLLNFINENNLLINDRSLPSNSFTYLSPTHNTASWIDHIISSHSMNIENISIFYDTSPYDHFPLRFKLGFPGLTVMPPVQEKDDLMKSLVNWSVFSDETKIIYNSRVQNYLESSRFF